MSPQTMIQLLDHSDADWSETGGRRNVRNFGDARAEYDALTSGAGLVPLLDRTQIEVTGNDRATFLHNVCTNDVKGLRPGEGCEAFFTNVQGKIVSHGFIFCREESMVLETVPGQAEKLLSHLDRYLISEKVELADRSADWGELLIAGKGAEKVLNTALNCQLPTQRLNHCDVRIGEGVVSLRRVDFTGPIGFLISGTHDVLAEVWTSLSQYGAAAAPTGQEAFEMARIEAGTPFYGQDITEKNLPQELARNDQAINFTKGCYLGQETVARIDALGHVNRTLCGFRFDGQAIPESDLELAAEDKVVGHVTSAAFSPRLNSPLALGFVRRDHNDPGVTLNSALGNATVVAIPVK